MTNTDTPTPRPPYSAQAADARAEVWRDDDGAGYLVHCYARGSWCTFYEADTMTEAEASAREWCGIIESKRINALDGSIAKLAAVVAGNEDGDRHRMAGVPA